MLRPTACQAILPVQGRFTLDVLRAGVVVERVDEPNMVVVGARVILAGLLGGGTLGLTQLGLGTDMTPSVFGNTALQAPYLRPLGAADFPQPNIVRFAFSLGTDEANGMNIAEFGLLTAAGVLFARKTRKFAVIPKDSTVALAGTWSIQF